METITIKLDENMLENIDKSLKKHNFSTRTEFIRDALREKLERMTQQEKIDLFLSLRGSVKRKHTDEELEVLREKAVRELVKERGWAK
jgi:metal-responsive CopG/Arc/MetJ family transcriptional regulator